MIVIFLWIFIHFRYHVIMCSIILMVQLQIVQLCTFSKKSFSPVFKSESKVHIQTIWIWIKSAIHPCDNEFRIASQRIRIVTQCIYTYRHVHDLLKILDWIRTYAANLLREKVRKWRNIYLEDYLTTVSSKKLGGTSWTETDSVVVWNRWSLNLIILNFFLIARVISVGKFPWNQFEQK